MEGWRKLLGMIGELGKLGQVNVGKLKPPQTMKGEGENRIRTSDNMLKDPLHNGGDRETGEMYTGNNQWI